MRAKIIIVVALVFMSANSAVPDTQHRNYLTGGLGRTFVSEPDNVSNDTYLSLGVGFDLTSFMGGQFIFEQHWLSIGSESFNNIEAWARARFHPITLDGKYTPYLVLGGAYVKASSSGDSGDGSTIGIGLDTKLDPRLGLSVELRKVSFEVNKREYKGTPLQACLTYEL